MKQPRASRVEALRLGLGACFGGMLVLGVACAGIFGAPRWLNHRTLAAQSAAMDALGLPPGSVEVARHDVVGLQVCCSNHCDFLTARTIDSQLDPVAFRRALDPAIELIDPTDPAVREIRGVQDLLRLDPGPVRGHRFHVMQFEQTFSGFAFDWDLRCH